MNVDIGDEEKKGDVLADLDPEPYQLELNKINAQLVKAKDGVVTSRAEYQRQKRIFEQGAGAKRCLDVAENQYKSAKSSVNVQVAILDLKKRDLRKTKLIAPPELLPATWKLLRNRMDDVKPELPQGTIAPMVDDTFGDTSVATIALWSDGFSMAKMHETARQIRERLNLMDGIQKIDFNGVQDERIYIEASSARLAQVGIDLTDIGRSFQEQNILLPGGEIKINDVEFIVETQGRFRTIEEIGEVLIPITGTQATIPLHDIAHIRKAYVEPVNNPADYNGHLAIVLSVFILSGNDAI